MVMDRGRSAERRELFNFDSPQPGRFIRAKMGFIERPRHLWLSPPRTQLSQIQHLSSHRDYKPTWADTLMLQIRCVRNSGSRAPRDATEFLVTRSQRVAMDA